MGRLFLKYVKCFLCTVTPEVDLRWEEIEVELLSECRSISPMSRRERLARTCVPLSVATNRWRTGHSPARISPAWTGLDLNTRRQTDRQISLVCVKNSNGPESGSVRAVSSSLSTRGSLFRCRNRFGSLFFSLRFPSVSSLLIVSVGIASL